MVKRKLTGARRWLAAHPVMALTTVGAVSAGGLLVALVWLGFADRISVGSDISYGDFAVAAGTLILAIATLGSVVLGWQALRDNQQEIAISRQEVENAQRPVVVPAIDQSARYALPGLTDQPAVPRAINGTVYIPVRNIGAGPALNIWVVINFPEFDAPWSGQGYGAIEPSLGVTDTTPVGIWVHNRLGALPECRVTLQFEDLAGKKWKTTAQYAPPKNQVGDGTFSQLKIERVPRTLLDGRVPDDSHTSL